jgi:hypothetical protein
VGWAITLIFFVVCGCLHHPHPHPPPHLPHIVVVVFLIADFVIVLLIAAFILVAMVPITISFVAIKNIVAIITISEEGQNIWNNYRNHRDRINTTLHFHIIIESASVPVRLFGDF